MRLLFCFNNFFIQLSEGKVVKITRESIHCIVLGFSSAIITDENIRNELKYKAVCPSILLCFEVHIVFLSAARELILLVVT